MTLTDAQSIAKEIELHPREMPCPKQMKKACVILAREVERLGDLCRLQEAIHLQMCDGKARAIIPNFYP